MDDASLGHWPPRRRGRCTAASLLIGQISSTAVGCPDDLQEQDEWLAGFFGSDPVWRLSNDRLMLQSGETVIELEARDG